MLNKVNRWNDAMVTSILCWYARHPVIMASSLSGLVAAYSAVSIIGVYGAIRLLGEAKHN